MSQTQSHSAPKRLTALSALSFAGFAVAIYLTQHYYEVRNGTAGFKSLCNLGQTMNCDAVAASTYAELLPGVPLSSFAAGGFLALLIVSIAARNPFWRRESVRALFALTGIGALFSLAYFAIMAGALHTFCLFCLITDAIALTSFGIALSLKPEGFAQHKPDTSKWKTLLALSAAAVIISTIALRGLDSSEIDSSRVAAQAQTILDTPPVSVNMGPEFPSFGSKDAPVTIVEFSDFQCPFCRMGAFTVNSVVQRYPTQVRVVFRNFPFDMGCNRLVQRPMHEFACDAAKAARCAFGQGKFEPVYEALFERQSSLGPGRALAIAQDAGADAAQLNTCFGAPETLSAITRDIDEGVNLGVQSTPTFFINGRKMEGALPPAVWNRVIDELLKKSK